MAIDWSKSMTHEFEYYIVDPVSWGLKSKLHNVMTASIKRDLSADTLGSASFKMTEKLGELYVRSFFVATQGAETYRKCLGTHLIQSPKYAFNGMFNSYEYDGFTPLIELKEASPQVGYSVRKGNSPMTVASKFADDNCRAPVIPSYKQTDILSSDFVANGEENWLEYIRDLASVSRKKIALSDEGVIMFRDEIDVEKTNHIWTYSEDNNSIWYPDVRISKDIYSIPNVVEAVYSTSKKSYHVRVANNSVTSPISVPNRGREIVYRLPNVFLVDESESGLRAYATKMLDELSKVQCTVSYSHGFCPVTIGDVVLIDYPSIGISNTKAIVVSQDIDCSIGAKVSETAQFELDLY